MWIFLLQQKWTPLFWFRKGEWIIKSWKNWWKIANRLLCDKNRSEILLHQKWCNWTQRDIFYRISHYILQYLYSSLTYTKLKFYWSEICFNCWDRTIINHLKIRSLHNISLKSWIYSRMRWWKQTVDKKELVFLSNKMLSLIWPHGLWPLLNKRTIK
jgi:hypothetical protein